MLAYEIKNETDQDKVIDGLGVVRGNDVKEFTPDEAAWFRTLKGVQLLPGNLPQGVVLTVVVKEDE